MGKIVDVGSNMAQALENIAEHITSSLKDKIRQVDLSYGELTIKVLPEHLIETVSFLQKDAACAFINITDISGVDYPTREKRFDVVYHLLSPIHINRIRIKIETDETTPVPSLVSLYPGAHWFEREAYDMYGILFDGHPDLRRILTDYGFEGHPLRKDFPTSGYVELRYDDSEKRVVYEPVKLNQEFRNFDFLSPWEGTNYNLPPSPKSGK